MYAIVLASRPGHGLAPLNFRTCVALLPVVGKAILVHTIEALAAAGVRQLTVVVAPHAEAVEQALGDGTRWGVQIDYATSGDEAADAVVARLRAARSGDCLVVRGDILRSAMLAEFLARAAAVPGPSVAATAGGTAAGLRLVRAEAGAVLDLPDDPDRERDWHDPAPRVDVADAVVTRLASLAEYLGANLDAAAGRYTGLIVPARETAPGVLVGRQARVDGETQVRPPVFVGARCDVKGAELLGGVVLSEDVVVDRGATLRDALVLPQTYIGAGVQVRDAIVWMNDLIDVRSGAVTHVTDTFLLADLRAEGIAGPLAALLQRSLGLALLVASLPLWPLLALAALAANPRRPFRRVRLLGDRRETGGPSRWTRRPFTTFEAATGIPVLRHLPRLIAVVTGDLRLVGVAPLTPETAAARAEAWELVRDHAPVGLIGPAEVELSRDAPPEEQAIAEAFYARTRTRAGDLRLLVRGAATLFTARAWTLPARHAAPG